MNSAFNNQDFIKRLTPDVGLLNKVRFERNWGIGVSIAIGVGFACYAYKVTKTRNKC